MRTLRLCFCLLVWATLFILGGCCKRHYYQAKINEVRGVENVCSPIPKIIENVHEGDRIDWGIPDHDYTILFKDPQEPIKGPIKLKQGVPDTPHRIKGTNGCDPDPDEKGKGVYCKYSITKVGESTPCAKFDDPGIHITP